MKRLLSLAAAIICFLSAAPSVFAAEPDEYVLTLLNMTIEAPEGWVTFSRDTEADDPDIELLGMDSGELREYYVQNNIYLNMISVEPYAEIVVTMTDYEESRDTYDFNLVHDEEMLPIAESIMRQMQEAVNDEVTYTDCAVYEHQQARFAVFYMTKQNSGMTVYAKQYYTVINGQAINITLHSYGTRISNGLEVIIKDTVDSVEFTKVTEKPAPVSAALIIALIIAAAGGAAGAVFYIRKKRMNVSKGPAVSRRRSRQREM